MTAPASGRESVLVSTDWLEAHLGDPDVRVVDVRGVVLPPGNAPRYRPKREEYEAGHIPGAVFIDWTRDIVDADDPIPVQLARAEAFAAKMGELGVGDGTRVIAYDDYRHAFSGRLAWALRYFGHEAVQVLEGGWSRWLDEGRPTSRAPADPPSARFTARPRVELRRSAVEVLESVSRSDVLVLDARASEQYEGKVSVARRAGHIPGARNVPYPSLVDPRTGGFLPDDELARVFVEAGVDPAAGPSPIIVYCNGGVTCTVLWSALRILGRDDVAVYDGSWNEWGNDLALPVETGPRTAP